MSEPSEEQIKEITDALVAGRKIEAIKIYRDATGNSLKDAKEFIDELTASLRQKHPDKFPASKAGCAPIFLLALGLGGLLTGAVTWLG